MRNFLQLHELITDTYSSNYNIVALHQKIQAQIIAENKFLSGLEENLLQLQLESQKRQTVIARENTMKKMKEVAQMIDLIRSKKRLMAYVEDTKQYIEGYQRLSTNVVFVNFWEPEIESEDESSQEKLEIIENYLEVAKQYIPLEVIRLCKFKQGACKNCGAILSGITNSDGIIVCQDCGVEHFTTIVSLLTKDNTTVYSDESKENFMRVLIRYEGLQAERPPPELFTDLDHYFTQLGRLTGEEIKKLPLNIDGTRGDTDHGMLWSALSKTGWSQNYEDSNLIGHLYWGWLLPQITPERKSKVLEHYDKTQTVFHKIPPEERERVSSLGTQYRLYRHLQLVGHPCHMKQFKIAENSESLRIHDKLWAKMCENANDPEIYFIP